MQSEKRREKGSLHSFSFLVQNKKYDLFSWKEIKFASQTQGVSSSGSERLAKCQ